MVAEEGGATAGRLVCQATSGIFPMLPMRFALPGHGAECGGSNRAWPGEAYLLLLAAHLPGRMRNKFQHLSPADMMYDVVVVSMGGSEELRLLLDLSSVALASCSLNPVQNVPAAVIQRRLLFLCRIAL